MKMKIGSRLKIPPMWSNVRISKDSSAHVQVTARDSKGKKQYIYHPKFIQQTTTEKFRRLQKFCLLVNKFIKSILLKIKSVSKIETREQLICLLFYILYKTYFRIGNETYDTYGLTTLEKRHVVITEKNIIFDFIGKKKIRNYKVISDPLINKLLKSLTSSLRRPTDRIFNDVSSSDMNNYIKEKMGQEFTCKDFRTYSSNVLFIKYLSSGCNLKESYDKVAGQLCHTKYVSKKSYIMSKIEQKYKEKPEIFNRETERDPESIIMQIKI